jgi:SAM-dependent methyltransferase
MGSHSERHVCRLCYGPTRVMLSLTPTPIANSFPAHPDKDAERFPLDIAECVDCGHVQQDYQATIDWVDYRYKTPDANRQHLAEAAADLKQRYPWAKKVLEIGSNNGLYLEELRKVGFDAVGVDPNAKSDISAPFSSALAYTLGQVDIIVANNVLAHVDDLWDVFRGIDRMLGMEGVLVFEVQDLESMMARGLFDMMYHEHRDYHSYGPIERFLKRWGLEIDWSASLSTHGGSRRYFCRRPERWRQFSETIKRAKVSLQWQLINLDGPEGPLACFGATAKACTLIHHFGLADVISYCVDDTPEKQGRYIPGTNIQIFPTSHLQEVPPKAVIMTAWNFKEVLLAKYPNLPWIIPFEEGAYVASR